MARLTDDDLPPFPNVPSGIAIAHYFWDETEHRNPSCDGIDLYRDGGDYCYVWVTSMVDLDMWEAYLLDVRTNVNGVETRDFLFVFAGAQFDVDWHNQPIRFDAPVEAHRERFATGMKWFTNLIERAVEDATGQA